MRVFSFPTIFHASTSKMVRFCVTKVLTIASFGLKQTKRRNGKTTTMQRNRLYVLLFDFALACWTLWPIRRAKMLCCPFRHLTIWFKCSPFRFSVFVYKQSLSYQDFHFFVCVFARCCFFSLRPNDKWLFFRRLKVTRSGQTLSFSLTFCSCDKNVIIIVWNSTEVQNTHKHNDVNALNNHRGEVFFCSAQRMRRLNLVFFLVLCYT